MLLKLKLSPWKVFTSIHRMYNEDAGFYAINQQRAGYLAPEFIQEFGNRFNLECLRHGANKIGETTTAWVTSGGNVLVIDTSNNTAVYCGVRHAAQQLAWMYVESFKTLEVLEYKTSMPWLKPWQTLEEFCRRACKTSSNRHERCLALMREGKTLAFLLAEGDLPLRDVSAMHKIALTKGYYEYYS